MTYAYKKLPDGRFECTECGEIKNGQSTMFYHMVAHEGNLPYKCKLCDKSFAQKSALEIHRSAKHDKKTRFICPSNGCSYECSTKANCRVHYVRKHAAAETGASDRCPSCQKECRSAHMYYYHIADCMTFPENIRTELAKVI